MKSPLRHLLAIFCLSLCAVAQTYTYKPTYSFNLAKKGFGEPSNSLLIVNGVGYGAAGPLYVAKPSGVRILVGCCNTSAALIADAAGDLYGVNGSGNGGVYELSPPTWDHTILYKFTGGNDGRIFQVEAPLIFDPQGNLWGTTFAGGANTTCNYGGGALGCGVIFELVNNNGAWSEKVIHSFAGPPDGAGPAAGLTYDPATGAFYGTTEYGGDVTCNGGTGCGTAFELSAKADGTWAETVLHTFEVATDGALPMANVILDTQGNVYGTTWEGGQSANENCSCGTIYELSNEGQFSVLHAFAGQEFNDGEFSEAPLAFDNYGALWGNTYAGGTGGPGYGTVFSLTPTNGLWNYSVFHSFQGQQQGKPPDGASPMGGLALDGHGNLYGTTSGGGAANYGTIYEIAVTP